MILRKPYAFLIKYFKYIHALLALLYVYLAFRTSSLLNYYNSIIKGTIGSTSALDYIDKLPFFVIILTFIICGILFVLMNHKKKPKLMYIIMVLLYIVVFVVISIVHSGLESIYGSGLDAKTKLLYRDFLRIILVFQYISIFLMTIRAIGFDIKKFNFSEDLHSLDIEITDDEEVELVMGVDKHKIVQKFYRRVRELKYYFAENKIFVLIMVGVIAFIGLSSISIDKTFVNKEYKENQEFSSDSFSMNILNSFLSSNSYDGTNLSKDKTFLIINLFISPLKQNKSLNLANMSLKVNNNSYKALKKYNKYFKDIGGGYENQIIKNSRNYIIVFQIPNEEIGKKMYISYVGSSREIKIKLSPINLDTNVFENEYKLGDTIGFENSTLSGSSFMVNSYEVMSKYSLSYTDEINGKSYEGKKNISSVSNTILKLNVSSNLRSGISTIDLLNDYSKIKYKKGEEEFETRIISNKTPNDATNNFYLEVNKDLESADSIWFEVQIRSAKYKYILK